MLTYTANFSVQMEHLDGGDHANWLAQLAIAERMLASFREKVGLGLEELKSRGFFLVMGSETASYHAQLRQADEFDAHLTIWISRPISLKFRCLFSIGGRPTTTMNWEMPLVCTTRGRPCKIPPWMVDIIGTEKPALPLSR